MTKNKIIHLLQLFYSKHNKPPTYHMSATELGISPKVVRRVFGAWSVALKESNIPTTKQLTEAVHTKCRKCGINIRVTFKLFHSRPNHFCSLSCAASINNKLFPKTPSTKPKRIKQAIPHPGKPVGSYTSIRYLICKICSKGGWVTKKRTTFPTTCSDKCFLISKRRNSFSRNRVQYKGYILDNRWELQIAQFLDDNCISWTVPEIAIPWIDSNGKTHKYYPDFFLPEFDLYVDPKNPLVINRQYEKLKAVTKIIHLIYGDIHELMTQLSILKAGTP